MKNQYAMLHPMASALAFGILWAFGILALSILAQYEVADAWVKLISNAYIGYTLEPLGILIGVAWAFIDAFIGGYLLAWLYNLLVRKFS